MKNFKLCDNPLYHGVKIENAVKILDEKVLSARTTQRYWPDGIRRKDKDPEYESSFIMKGWSTSRDFYFAGAWSGVVFVLDKEEIKNNFEIMPISWNYSMAGLRDHKKEREEFIIARKTGMSFDDFRDQHERKRDELYDKYEETGDKTILKELKYNDYLDYLKAPEKKIIPLSAVKGVFIEKELIDIYKQENEMIKKIMAHTLYKGLYDGNDVKLKNKQNQETVQTIISRLTESKRRKL